MNLTNYPFSSSNNMMTFEFISEGEKGRIKKVIQYQRTHLKNVYNLAFGDIEHSTGKLDDTITSNNGDSNKVLSTVVATIYAFSERYPDFWIYASGSTKSRTRLYRIGITKYLAEFTNEFELLGELEEGWEVFRINVEYQGYLTRRKRKNS